MKRLLALGAVLVLVLTGCSDDKKDADGQRRTDRDDPVALLTDAKKTIDEAASVHIVHRPAATCRTPPRPWPAVTAWRRTHRRSRAS